MKNEIAEKQGMEVGLLKHQYPTITKQGINDEVERLVQAVDEGEMDPLKLIAYLAGIDRVIKAVRPRIMEHAIAEHAKYGEKHFVVLEGAEVEVAESGGRSDFSKTEPWNELKAEEAKWTTARKELEKMLKTLKHATDMQWEDELVTMYPPIKTSTTTVKVTIK